MKNEFEEFDSHDQLTLFSQRWLPAEEPKARLVIVHGLGEHSDRYANLVGPLIDHGIAVHSYDLRGHGRSGGQRGHIGRWQSFRLDLNFFLDRVREDNADGPIFLYGHSLGSLIVLEALIQGSLEVDGVILSGVALDPEGIGTPFQVSLAKLLSRFLPRFSLDSGLDPDLLSNDPAVIEAYQADPMVHSRATVRFATESLAAINRINAKLDRIEEPILLLHGEQDHLTTVSGARRVLQEVSSDDTEFCLYSTARHEPHNDVSQHQVSQDVLDWLERQLD